MDIDGWAGGCKLKWTLRSVRELERRFRGRGGQGKIIFLAQVGRGLFPLLFYFGWVTMAKTLWWSGHCNPYNIVLIIIIISNIVRRQHKHASLHKKKEKAKIKRKSMPPPPPATTAENKSAEIYFSVCLQFSLGIYLVPRAFGRLCCTNTPAKHILWSMKSSFLLLADWLEVVCYTRTILYTRTPIR